MDPAGFCRQARVFIVAGKGGVGKTTVSASLARMAATAGLSSLVVELEATSGLAAAFGHQGLLGYDEVALAPGIGGRAVGPDDALVEYLEGHGMGRLSRRLLSSGAIDVVATATPGIKDILVLGKVKQLEQSGAADVIVVDAPAAGHAVRFLTSAAGLTDAVRSGPIRTQAEDVAELLADPSRCQVLLVTLAEETPVNEVVETAYTLEDRVGVTLAPVVVNGLYPVLDGLDIDPDEAAAAAGVALRPGEADSLRRAADFRRSRARVQAAQVARLADALPLTQLHLPLLFSTGIGPPEVQILAGHLARAVAAATDRPRSETRNDQER
ncbi:MAG: ArsA family ATPase [Acidimicrobiales bacterium]